MSGVELATAWVRLVPSVDGISDQITKQFLPGTKTAGEEGDKAGRSWAGKLKGALGAAAIGAVVVGAFKGLYDVGDTFNDLTNTIRVGTGAQGDALDGLVRSAKNVGLNVPAEFDKIAPTVADLNTRLGLSGDTLETVASQYLEAGRILGEDVDIMKTGAAFNAFKIEGDAVSDAMDHLFQVSQATGIGMNELASQAQAQAPALQALGFGFEEATVMIGSFDKAGLNSSQIMSSLSRSLVNLAKDGEEPQAAFERVVGEIDNFIDVGDQAAAIDLAGQVFGTSGASQFIGALESGALNLEDMMSAAGQTGDTILGLGEETMTFSEQWQKTMNTGMVAIEPFATAVFDGLGGAMEAVMPYLQSMGEWVSENTGVIGIIAGVIGVTLVAAFIAWTASIWASTVALLANPITWIVLAVVALIAAVVALVMNWDEVVAFISDIWSGFIDWIVGIIDGFVAWWDGVWQGVLGFFSGIWEGLKSAGAAAIDWIAAKISAVVTTISGIWSAVWGAISSFFSTIWGTIVSAAGRFTDSVKNTFENVMNFIRGIPDKVMGFFSGIGDLLKNSGKALVDGFLSGIKNAWSTLTGWVSDGLGAIRDLFPFSPAKTGPFSGSGWVDRSGESLGRTFADSIVDSLKAGRKDISSGLAGIQGDFAGFDAASSGFSASIAGHMSVSDAHILVDRKGPVRVSSAGLLASVKANERHIGGDVYVQNPFTGEYLLAKTAEVADQRIGEASRSGSKQSLANMLGVH